MGKVSSYIKKSLILPMADKVMKTNIASAYKQLKGLQKCSKQELERWQNENLEKLILHAYHYSPYYRNLFNVHGLVPNDIKEFKDLTKIPVLTKEDIRNNYSAIISEKIKTIPYKESSTGGSTGDPLKYLLDHRSWSISNANTILNWERVGYQYGDIHLALGSTSLFVDKTPTIKHQIYYQLKNKIGLNGVNMSDEVCRTYINFIINKKVKFIYGYASSIYLLAKYCITNNLTLNIEACFPTSEVLKTLYRKTIEDAFRCKIVDCYGAQDGGIAAFSHVEDYFEVGYNCMVHIDKPNSDGIGPALLTDLFNYAMPLINYKIGDEILINETRNKTYDYNGQIINQVLGRTSDIIELENGNILTGPGFTILFKDLPVEHYCIEKTGINAIKCHIVKLPTYTIHHEQIVKSTFYNQMGHNSELSINYTATIPLTKSGKRKYFG